MTETINLWQLSSLLWQAAQTAIGQPVDRTLANQIHGLLDCTQTSQWPTAIRTLLSSFQNDEDHAIGVNPDNDKAQSQEASLTAIRLAWQAFAKKERESTRFQAAVEARVAETMYNFCYGLTHEINNPLANISARAQGLKSRAQDDSTRQSLENIVHQANRAHEMLAEMMLAVRSPEIPLELLDFRCFLEEISPGLQSQATAAQLQFTQSVDVRSLPVFANQTAMREVLQAIFQNSLEACEVGGCIHLLCHRIEPNEGDALQGAMPKIRVAMMDNGQGMNAEQIRKAFDLYYCGREAGRTLGVGLAKAKRIVEAHAGTIELCSLPKVGTAVEIKLPWAIA